LKYPPVQPKVGFDPQQRKQRSLGTGFNFTCARLAEALAHPNHWGDLFETNRRTRWPFHIHNPVMTITGRKTNRVKGA
jgi:hypothetical protein